MKRWMLVLTAVFALAAALPAGAQTQSPGLSLNLRRNFGFSAGGRVQGAFTLTATGPDDLARVDFLFDGKIVSTAVQAPFAYSFSTGAYPLGVHTMSATGLTTSGARLTSTVRSVEFVSPEVGWQVGAQIGLPILGVVLLISLVATLAPLLLDRQRGPFRPGVYGAAGGAICPRCKLPFPLHVMSMHVLTGKLERCPHCGKWSLVGRASAAALAEAEARLQDENSRGRLAEPSTADTMRQMIEDSRYEET